MKVYSKLNRAKSLLKPNQILFAKDKQFGEKIVKEYVVFDSYEQYEKLKEDKHYYEIINGMQCLYMDIDIPGTEKKEEVFQFIDDLEKHIKSIYNTGVNIYCSNTDKKYSYHVKLRSVIAYTNMECRKGIEDMLSTFDHPFKKYIDMKIYRKNQLLRLLGSSKIGKDNVKVFLRGYDNSFEESLICTMPPKNIEFKIL